MDLNLIDGNNYSIQSSTKTESYIVKAIEGMGINIEGSLCIVFTVCLPNVKTLNELTDYFKNNAQNIKQSEKLLYLSDISNPKDVLLEARELAENFVTPKYFIILNELFEYTKSHLTTKELAKYVLEKIT